jgi:hypothetical protein
LTAIVSARVTLSAGRAYSLDCSVHSLRNEAILEGVIGIGSILDCRVCQAVPNCQTLEANVVALGFLVVLVDCVGYGRNIVPASYPCQGWRVGGKDLQHVFTS